MPPRSLKGQLLLEILVVIGVAATVVALGAQLIVVSLQSNKASGEKDVGLALVEETFEAVRNATSEKWQNLFNLTESSNYYPTKSAGKWVISNAGIETVTVNDVGYSRSFIVQNMCRNTSTKDVTVITDTNGTTQTCNDPPTGDSYDPSTQKVTATVSWSGADALSSSEYLSRWSNKVCLQTNWSGGAAGPGTGTACPITTYDTQTNIDFGTVGSIKISP